MRRWLLMALPFALLACSSGDDKDDSRARVAQQTPSQAGIAADAGAPRAVKSAPAAAPAPSEDGWLDPPPRTTRWGGSAAPKRDRVSAPIAIQLRSTPPGATVMVDGRQVGVTPTYWEGSADGKAHDFVFILAEHAVAHYRFVPVQSGHVHPRLEKLLEPELTDAGLPVAPAVN